MKASSSRPRILIVVAVPMTINYFLLNYLRALSKDYDVTVACSDEGSALADILPTGVSHISTAIHRKISLLGDLKSLFCLVRLMQRQNFDMIHSVTPKAGLLAQLAAWFSGVGIRIHTFTGQVWATKEGISRSFLKTLDRIIALSATQVLADSASQRDFLIAENVVSTAKIEVLGHGSISGVDVKRFQPDSELRQIVREQLGFSEVDVLALFIGRLTRDKGVLDLIRAFNKVSEGLPSLSLLLVGPDEEGMEREINRLSGSDTRIRILGKTQSPENFMAAADFLCLPSYREGFGSVVIEAAASGLPAMVSSIYGLTDAVQNGVSGQLHAPKDVEAIAELLQKFTNETKWRQRLGQNARRRALEQFSAEYVVEAQMRFVHGMLVQRDD